VTRTPDQVEMQAGIPSRLPDELKFSNYCLALNGVNQYVWVLGAPSLRPDADSYTWRGWVKPDLSQIFIFASTYTLNGWCIRFRVDGRIEFLWNDGADRWVLSNIGDVVSGIWQEIGVVLNRTDNQIYFYINGLNTAIRAYVPAINLTNLGTVYLGYIPHFAQFGKGYIDEIQFLRGIQTPSQMYENFLCGHARPTVASTLNLRIEAGAGDTVYDDSGFGNNGTRINNPPWTKVAKHELLAEAGV